MKVRTLSLTIAAAALLAAFAPARSEAQTQIWTVPTTDTAAPHSKYLEGDLVVNPRSYGAGGYTSLGGRYIYGLGKRTEFGVNLFGTGSNPPSPLELQPNFKYSLYANEKTGVAAAVGTMLYIPLANRQYGDDFGMVYAIASKKLGGANGPRFSAGGWGLVGRQHGTGSQSGVMLGYEQPINQKYTFAVDWMSGNQIHGGFSSLTAGVFTQLSKNSTLGTGYSFANSGSSNNALVVFYGRSF